MLICLKCREIIIKTIFEATMNHNLKGGTKTSFVTFE